MTVCHQTSTQLSAIVVNLAHRSHPIAVQRAAFRSKKRLVAAFLLPRASPLCSLQLSSLHCNKLHSLQVTATLLDIPSTASGMIWSTETLIICSTTTLTQHSFVKNLREIAPIYVSSHVYRRRNTINYYFIVLHLLTTRFVLFWAYIFMYTLYWYLGWIAYLSKSSILYWTFTEYTCYIDANQLLYVMWLLLSYFVT